VPFPRLPASISGGRRPRAGKEDRRWCCSGIPGETDDIGQAGLRLPESDTEIVLTEHQPYEPAWLVSSAVDAARVVTQAGGQVLEGPVDIPVGTVVVVRDPFGNRLVLLDLSKGGYLTDAEGRVTGVS
jgi:hypothetical protein